MCWGKFVLEYTNFIILISLFWIIFGKVTLRNAGRSLPFAFPVTPGCSITLGTFRTRCSTMISTVDLRFACFNLIYFFENWIKSFWKSVIMYVKSIWNSEWMIVWLLCFDNCANVRQIYLEYSKWMIVLSCFGFLFQVVPRLRAFHRLPDSDLIRSKSPK